MNYSANYRAVVVDNADPKGLSRVRLKIPQILGDGATGWAYPIGAGTVPNVGSQVWATFEGGDISFPTYHPAMAARAHTHPEADVTSLVGDILNLSATKASLSGAAFTGNISTTGTLTRGGVNVPSVTVSGTAPSSPTTGDIWVDTSDSWTSYTPAIGGTGWSIGTTGSQAIGYYATVGKTVHFSAQLQFGTTGATFGTAQPTVSIPVTHSANHLTVGTALYYHSGTTYMGMWQIGSSGTTASLYTGASPSANVSSTVPFTWATTDIIRVNGTYESS